MQPHESSTARARPHCQSAQRLFSQTRLLLAFSSSAALWGCAPVPEDAPQPGPVPADVEKTNGAVATGTADSTTLPIYPYVGKWTTANGGSCSGTLITSQWVLTAAHCFNGWQADCIGNLLPGEPFTLQPDLTRNITINFGGGKTAVHTAAVSGPARVRMDDVINACSNADTANDIALFKLDKPIRPEILAPLHPALSSKPEDWCSTLVGDHDDFDGVLVGFGGLGVRNYAQSSDWNLEDVGTGYVYRNGWGFSTYQGLQPGDSGGPLVTAGLWKNDFGLAGPRLCGVNSRVYFKFPGVQTNASADAAVDFSDNRAWIEQAVLRPNNPYGRIDGGFEGERLSRQDLFAIGNDGNLHMKSVIKDYMFGSDWKNLGNLGVALAKVSAVSWGPGRIDVFAVGVDDQVYHAYSDDGGEGFGWDAWGSPPASLGNFGIDVVSGRPGRLDIFATYDVAVVRGPTDGSGVRLYHRSWDNGADSGWRTLGHGPFETGALSGPGAAAAALGRDRLDVWVTAPIFSGPPPLRRFDGTTPPRPTNGRALQHAFSEDGGASWGWDDWTPSEFTITGDPDATSWGPGRLDLFVAGTDHRNHHVWWDNGNSAWDVWTDTTGSPSTVSMGPGSLTVAHLWNSNASPNTVILQSFHAPPGSIPQTFDNFAFPQPDWIPIDIDLSSF